MGNAFLSFWWTHRHVHIGICAINGVTIVVIQHIWKYCIVYDLEIIYKCNADFALVIPTQKKGIIYLYFTNIYGSIVQLLEIKSSASVTLHWLYPHSRKELYLPISSLLEIQVKCNNKSMKHYYENIALVIPKVEMKAICI
jgi:hypothetical protein